MAIAQRMLTLEQFLELPETKPALEIYPRTRWVRTFRPGLESGQPRGSDQINLDDVLPGVRLPVDEIFSKLRGRRG